MYRFVLVGSASASILALNEASPSSSIPFEASQFDAAPPFVWLTEDCWAYTVPGILWTCCKISHQYVVTSTCKKRTTLENVGCKFLYFLNAIIHLSAASTVSNLKPHVSFQPLPNGNEITHKTKPYPLSLSLTCLVKVLTLFTTPNGSAIACNCSSGKCGGNPLM